jgi:AcrR family transcriptional regulator
MTQPQETPRVGDLTARARILDVALRHFGEKGEGGTTFRGVAADAGVSPGLVQHHFGSKEALRAACDVYVLEALRAQSKATVVEGRLAGAAYVETAYAAAPLLQRYLGRVLVDGSPAAAALFDEIVKLTEHYLRKAGGTSRRPAQRRAQAAVFATMKLGLAVFHEQLVRSLGVRDPREGYPLIARALLDILAPELVGADLVAQARRGLDGYERVKAAKKPARTPAQRKAVRA